MVARCEPEEMAERHACTMTFRTLERLFIQEYEKNATSQDYYPCLVRLVEDDIGV